MTKGWKGRQRMRSVIGPVEGEADEHIEAEVATEASSEECEDSSDSEVKVIYGWND